MNSLVAASGAHPVAPIALRARNRPVALAALLGLIAQGRNIRMIHVHQSSNGIARDVARLKPAVVLGLPEDLSEQM